MTERRLIASYAGPVSGLGEATAHRCRSDDLTEVGLSNCDAGCKVMTCPVCTAEYVAHSSVYGCQRAREDYFRPMDGPSIAAIHRQWLDRGLPAATWAYFAKAATR
ncbi:hypothetical protein ACPXB5_11490 [Micromonospora arida]|uniref:hypothetical protein n=1 Tax=Micromonospora arida TaxID=2203715 RepID=UPI003CF2FB70